MSQAVGRRGFNFRGPGSVPGRSLRKLVEKVAQGQGFYPSLPLVPSQFYFSRMTHTLLPCAYYPCCIMLLGMIPTAFVKHTIVSHNATCYVQERFYTYVRVTAKSAC